MSNIFAILIIIIINSLHNVNTSLKLWVGVAFQNIAAKLGLATELFSRESPARSFNVHQGELGEHLKSFFFLN